MSKLRAIVVGGGVAGLASSVALARAGISVTQVGPPADATGTPRRAFQLWSNAVAALTSLGIEVRRGPSGLHTLELVEIRAYSGELLWTLPVGPWSGATASGMIWEKDLLDLLAARNGAARHLHSRLCGLSDDGVRVQATLESGAVLDADFLVGADGLDSCVRDLLLGPDLPRSLGQVMSIGETPADTLEPGMAQPGRLLGPGRAYGTQAADRRFWAVRMHDTVYWMATVLQDLANTRAGAPQGEWKSELAHLLRHAPGPTAALVAAGVCGAPFLVRDRPPARAWVVGAVGLLGDAAHPMTPDLGQGACLALEDAVVLADAVRRLGARGGLAHYARERRTRADAVAALSHAMAASALPGEPRRAWLRDRLTPLVVPPLARSVMTELLSYRPPKLP